MLAFLPQAGLAVLTGPDRIDQSELEKGAIREYSDQDADDGQDGIADWTRTGSPASSR
jgi:hypothetical protein